MEVLSVDEPEAEEGVRLEIPLDDEADDWQPPPRHEPADSSLALRKALIVGGVGTVLAFGLGMFALSHFLGDGGDAATDQVEAPPELVAQAENEPPMGEEGALPAEGEDQAETADEQPAEEDEALAAASDQAQPAAVGEYSQAHAAQRPEQDQREQAPSESAQQASPQEQVSQEAEQPDGTDGRLAAIANLTATEEDPAEEDPAEEDPREAQPEQAQPDEAAGDQEPGEADGVAEAAAEGDPAVPGEPAAEEPPAKGSFKLAGNAVDVYLKSASGKRYKAGAQIDAGKYDIWALFSRDTRASHLRVGVANIGPGAMVTIQCDANMMICLPK